MSSSTPTNWYWCTWVSGHDHKAIFYLHWATCVALPSARRAEVHVSTSMSKRETILILSSSLTHVLRSYYASGWEMEPNDWHLLVSAHINVLRTNTAERTHLLIFICVKNFHLRCQYLLSASLHCAGFGSAVFLLLYSENQVLSLDVYG